jgi:uncharacterized protein
MVGMVSRFRLKSLDQERSTARRKAFHYIRVPQGPQANTPSNPAQTMLIAAVSPTRPVLVLDTNIVLDWLVFRDPSCEQLAAAIRSRRVQWIASRAMRDELEHVLTRKSLERWAPDTSFVRDRWDHWAHAVEIGPLSPSQTLHCTDPDDQKFIDLAVHAAADALISRDRALLRLARRARARGVDVLTPTAWTFRKKGGSQAALVQAS